MIQYKKNKIAFLFGSFLHFPLIMKINLASNLKVALTSVLKYNFVLQLLAL